MVINNPIIGVSFVFVVFVVVVVVVVVIINNVVVVFIEKTYQSTEY